MRNPEAPVDAAAVPSSAAETPPSFTYETPRYWTEAAVKLNYHPRDGGANNGWWLGAADDGRYDRLRRIALERRQRRRAGLPSAPAQRQAQGGVRRPHTRGVVQGSYRLQGGMGGAGAGGALAATRQRRRQDDRRPATGNMAARGRATGKHRDMQRLRVVGADNGWKRPSTSTGLGVGPTPMRVTAAAVGSARNVTSSSAAQRRPGTTGGKALPRDRVAADVAAREGKAGGAQPSHVQHRGPRPASRLRSPPQRTPVDHPEDSGDVEEPSLALPAFHAIRSQYFMTAGGHDTYGTSAGMMSPIRVAAGGAPRSGAVPFSGSAGAPPVRGSLPSASRQERRPRTAVATPSTRRTPTSPVMGSPAPSSRQSTPFSTVRIGTSLNMPSFYLQKTKPGADTSVLYTALFPNLPVEHVDHSMTLKRECALQAARMLHSLRSSHAPVVVDVRAHHQTASFTPTSCRSEHNYHPRSSTASGPGWRRCLPPRSRRSAYRGTAAFYWTSRRSTTSAAPTSTTQTLFATRWACTSQMCPGRTGRGKARSARI